MTAFADTSGLYAVLDSDDESYAVAVATWPKLLDSDARLITTNYNVLETSALVQRRLGIGALRVFHEDICPVLAIEWITAEQHHAAVQAVLSASMRTSVNMDCGLSLSGTWHDTPHPPGCNMTNMNRRDILKIGASMAAIPAAAPAQSHPPQPPAWTPSFFNPHQNDTITDFSDLVIPATDTPGAKDALVNRYLDKILTASDHPFQNEFARDLDALDRFSRQIAGGDFVRLTPDKQKSVLEKMFQSNQRPSFDRLKAWTARIYYATKPGFDELNKGARIPATVACK